MTAVEIRPARPAEHDTVVALLLDAYGSVPGLEVSTAYEAELRDIERRSDTSEVLVAVDDAENVVGTITYVPTSAAADAEFDDPAGAGIRMLAVATAHHRSGVGRALTTACIERATAAGRRALYLHTTEVMTAATALYEDLGFRHEPALDWDPVPGVHLLGYRLELEGAGSAP